MLFISQHTFPDLLQPKLGLIFFPASLTLFYLQKLLFSGNALRTPEYTDLLLNSHGLCPKSHPQMFSTWTEEGGWKGERDEGRQRGKVCLYVRFLDIKEVFTDFYILLSVSTSLVKRLWFLPWFHDFCTVNCRSYSLVISPVNWSSMLHLFSLYYPHFFSRLSHYFHDSAQS